MKNPFIKKLCESKLYLISFIITVIVLGYGLSVFMKNSEQLTYAMSLLPDQEAAAQIKAAVKALADNCGNSFMVEHDVPPHLTLGVFHARESDLARLQELFRDFAQKALADLEHSAAQKFWTTKNDSALSLEFFGADNFLDKVIFLSLGSAQVARKKNPELFGLNAALHDIIGGRFEPGDNRNYIPANWHPHIALAVKMNAAQFKKGFDFAQSLCLPKRAGFVALSLALCKPYKEIERVALYFT